MASPCCSRSHSWHTPHLARLLRTSDRPVVAISTWLHTTLTAISTWLHTTLTAISTWLHTTLTAICTWLHTTLTQTDLHASSAIRTHNLVKRAAADPRFRQSGHWDQPYECRLYVQPGLHVRCNDSLRLYVRGSNPGGSNGLIFSPKLPDRQWTLISIISNR